MNSYELSRKFWDWAFKNPEKIKPNHSAIYFFAIEHCNRLGWKEKFGYPTTMVMEAIGIKSYNTYIKHFNELVEWGFFKLIERSMNQHSSNIISFIAISKNDKANNESLDKAFIKHTSKQSESTSQSNDSIDKQITKEPINNKPITNNKKPKAFSSEVQQCYDDLLNYFLDTENPDTDKIVETWKDTIDKLNRIDGLSFDDIRHLVQKIKQDDFWKGQFQSINKLRKRNKEGVIYWKYFLNKFKNEQNGSTSKSEQRMQELKNW